MYTFVILHGFKNTFVCHPVDCELVIEPPCELNVPPSRSSADLKLQSVRIASLTFCL